MTIARHVRVKGRVQGVFFRAWTMQQADALGLNGWVRNCADGSVEAHVEGDEGALEALIAQMGEGPSGALVEDMQVEEVGASGLRGFEVRH